MKAKQTLNLMVEAGKEFLEDDVPQAAAALSFYAVTALPPLVMILVGTIGLVYDNQQAVNQLSAQVSQLLTGLCQFLKLQMASSSPFGSLFRHCQQHSG